MIQFLHMPQEEAQRAGERGLAAALTHYFELRAQWIERDRRELFRLGWRYLAVGFVVLTACLLLSQLLPRLIGEGPTTKIIQEGLVILGWVANWETARDIPLRLVAAQAARRPLSPDCGGGCRNPSNMKSILRKARGRISAHATTTGLPLALFSTHPPIDVRIAALRKR